MKRRILALVLSIAMCLGLMTGCGGNGGASGGKKDAFVIMTEQLDGLFNPFFYTAAPDGTIVSIPDLLLTV